MTRQGHEDVTVALVYQFVLEHNGWPLADIPPALGIDVHDFDDAVDRLERLRLLRRSALGELVAVSPRLAADALVREEASLIDRQLYVRRLQQRVIALERRHVTDGRQGDPYTANAVEQVPDVRVMADDLNAQVQQEVALCVPGAAPAPEALDAGRSLELLRRDVRMRVMLHEAGRSNTLVRQYADTVTQLGAQVRTGIDLPPPIAVIDGELAVVGTERFAVVLLRQPELVSLLHSIFEILWHDARPFLHASDSGHHRPTATENSLLRWLAEGCKDETMARYLGVSLRTCRRYTADLMRRLEASSRFEAGVKAVRRGWLT